MDDVSVERWLPIVEVGGQYEASSLGRVRSVDRRVPTKGGFRTVRGRILRQRQDPKGYMRVGLSYRNKFLSRTVHKLVAEAFLGPRPAGMEIMHGPGGQLDNRPSNLNYGTHTDNERDKLRDGTLARGSRVGTSKLTEATVRECRKRYAAGGVTTISLAAEFGVCTAAMGNAVMGRTWKHVA